MAVLTLNRPGRLNAIGRDVLGLLAGTVAASAADERVRALVITGAGRAFSAGADLDEIEALPDARAFREFIARMIEVIGEPITAERAHAVGLVNELAGPGQALTAALGLAAWLAAGAPLALAAGKRLVDQSLGLDLAAAIGYERESVGRLFGTADRAEGLAAFRERRPPTFTGR